MNRSLAGQWLTTDELRQIAVDHGLNADVTSIHGDAAQHSQLLSITAATRFSMFMKGLLTLDTRR